jgi:hypothetical protein
LEDVENVPKKEYFALAPTLPIVTIVSGRDAMASAMPHTMTYTESAHFS